MKARPIKMAAMFIVALLISSLSQAQWYVGASLGEAETDQGVGFDRPPNNHTDDSTELVWKLFGGYNVTPAFAVEFGYTDLGNEYETINILGSNEEIRLDISVIGATLIGRSEVHDKVDFFGRIGVAHWDVDLRYTESGFSTSGSDSDIDVIVGLGFQWGVSDAVGLRFEWQQFQNVGDEVTTNSSLPDGNHLQLNGQDINVLAIGMSYRF